MPVVGSRTSMTPYYRACIRPSIGWASADTLLQSWLVHRPRLMPKNVGREHELILGRSRLFLRYEIVGMSLEVTVHVGRSLSIFYIAALQMGPSLDV